MAQLSHHSQDKGQIDVVYIHADHLNAPRLATNDKRQPVWQWRSDAFGVGEANDDLDQDGVKTNIALRFPGQYADKESGLFYNYFRNYDPETGRYLQSDPIGLAGGMNTYGYVGGNPVNYIDPFGLKCVSVNGITTCTPEIGLFKPQSFATPKGWDDFDASDFNFHKYLFEHDVGNGNGNGCKNYEQRLKEELLKSPTNDVNAATSEGAINDVGPLHFGSGQDHVKSYTTNDGILNVTLANHAVGSGFVMRKILPNGRGGYKIVTYGEGDSLKQLLPGGDAYAEEFWKNNASLIEQRARE